MKMQHLPINQTLAKLINYQTQVIVIMDGSSLTTLQCLMAWLPALYVLLVWRKDQQSMATMKLSMADESPILVPETD